MLHRSAYHDGLSANAPMIGAWFDANPAGTEPDEAAFAALAADFKTMKANKTAGIAGTRVNYTMPETRSLFTATARGADKMDPPYKEAFLALDKKWAKPEVWEAMRVRLVRLYHGFLSDFAGPGARRRGRHPAGAGKHADLCLSVRQDVPAVGPDHHLLSGPGLSGGASAGGAADVEGKPVDDLRSAAVLDLASGAHDQLDRGAAGAGDRERCADRTGDHRRGWPAGDDVQPDRHDHRDDACAAAVHDPAAVFGDEDHPAKLCPRRAQSGGDQLDDVPPGLSAADAAGHRGGGVVGVHPGGRLLHHARRWLAGPMGS